MTGTLSEDLCMIPHCVLLRMRSVSTKDVEKFKTLKSDNDRYFKRRPMCDTSLRSS